MLWDKPSSACVWSCFFIRDLPFSSHLLIDSARNEWNPVILVGHNPKYPPPPPPKIVPILLCAVKTVEGDFRFCWMITPNVGQTHKENLNLVRILYMVCTLNDIYKQYNNLHEHWYTKISSLHCVEDRNRPQNASDLYMKYWSYAEHCRPCTRLSDGNWWKQNKKKWH